MRMLIRDYNLSPRIALVNTGSVSSSPDNEYEVLSVEPTRLVFSSDGASIELGSQDISLIENLKDGNIVTVTENGIVEKIFDLDADEATVFLSGKCNSNCVMCPESDYERRMSSGLSEEWMHKYIDMLPKDLDHLVVTGGEPTLDPERFFSVMSHLADQLPDTETLLLSNGRSFASKTMVDRMLEHCPRFLTVAVPIHGHTPLLHDSITRARGSFRQSCMGIKNLLSRELAVELRVVVSRINYRHLSDIASYIISEFSNVQIVNFIGLEVLGNCAKYFSRVYLDYAESFMHIKPAVDILLSAGIATSLYNYPFCTVERGYWTLCRQSISPHKIRYAPSCDLCDMRPQCGGFFGSTLSVAKPKVRPIHF